MNDEERSPTQGVKNIEELDQLIQLKQYSLALIKIDKIIADSTAIFIPTYYHYRALIYYLLSNADAAMDDLNTVIEHYPNTFSRTYVLLGLIYSYLKNDFEKAIFYLKQAIKINDKDLDAYYQLVSLYKKANQLEDAIQIIKMAIKSVPEATATKEIYQSLLQIKISQITSQDYKRTKNLPSDIASLTITKAANKNIHLASEKKLVSSLKTSSNRYALKCGIDIDDYHPLSDEECEEPKNYQQNFN
jgi:tetratricopeptide (TPR) repeat protein